MWENCVLLSSHPFEVSQPLCALWESVWEGVLPLRILSVFFRQNGIPDFSQEVSSGQRRLKPGRVGGKDNRPQFSRVKHGWNISQLIQTSWLEIERDPGFLMNVCVCEVHGFVCKERTHAEQCIYEHKHSSQKTYTCLSLASTNMKNTMRERFCRAWGNVRTHPHTHTSLFTECTTEQQ